MAKNQIVRSPQSRGKRFALTVLLGGASTITLGCGIPCLRHAEPGPPSPADYQLNNGLPFFNDPPTELTEPQLEAGASDDATSSTILDGPANANTKKASLDSPADVESNAEQQSLGGLIRAASYTPSKHAPPQTAEEPLAKSIPSVMAVGQIKAAEGIALESEGLLESGGPTLVDESSAYLPVAAFYSDENLLALIQGALTGNQELKILAEEIRIAANESYARSGEYLPFVTLGGGAGLDKVGRHTRFGAVEEELNVAPGREFPEPLGDFLVAADVSWEIDIWHRLRNAQRSAAMRYLGSQEGRNYIVTRVAAEVAENYYDLLALDNQLETLDRTIEIQQNSLKVAEAKKAAGRGTELAVQRFLAEVDKNKSQRTIIRQRIVEAENRINFLLGRYPQPVDRISSDFLSLNLTALGAGIPSELLQNRADIRQAEREVAAAGLDVQVARARFYPNLSLTAGLGWNAFSTGYLFRTPESLIYGVAGELAGPLINKRAIQADYRTANAAQLQAIYNYQQTVLEAHIEVVNYLTKVENFRRSIELKKQQLVALEASVTAANKLFQNARAEYVEVLLAQRELQEARMEIIETKSEQLAAIVKAYQALGGGGF